MEILFKAITFTLLFLLIASPFLVIAALSKLKVRYGFFLYIISGIILTFILTVISGWWGYYSNNLLLSHYGYDFDAMNNFDRFKDVTATNLDKVKNLESNRLGVGWPLKVIMFYMFFSPILFILYSAVYFFKRNRQKKRVTV